VPAPTGIDRPAGRCGRSAVWAADSRNEVPDGERLAFTQGAQQPIRLRGQILICIGRLQLDEVRGRDAPQQVHQDVEACALQQAPTTRAKLV
jgi:hypothetical protein